MTKVFLTIVVLANCCLLRAMEEQVAVIPMGSSADRVPIYQLIGELAKHINSAQGYCDLLKSRLDPYAVSTNELTLLGEHLARWQLQLIKRQDEAFDVQVSLGAIIQKLQTVRIQQALPVHVVEEGKAIDYHIQQFLQCINNAVMVLFRLNQEIKDLRNRAEQGERVPWYIAQWDSHMCTRSDDIARLVNGFTELSQAIKNLNIVPTFRRGRANSWPCTPLS